jgi:hypothetical protein
MATIDDFQKLDIRVGALSNDRRKIILNTYFLVVVATNVIEPATACAAVISDCGVSA